MNPNIITLRKNMWGFYSANNLINLQNRRLASRYLTETEIQKVFFSWKINKWWRLEIESVVS